MVRNELKHAYQPWGRVNYDSTWNSMNNLCARPTYYFEELCKQSVTYSGLTLFRKKKS